MSFAVTAKTVEAINGVRSRGFLGEMHAVPTTDALYQLVANADGKVLATIDEGAGTISYAQEETNG